LIFDEDTCNTEVWLDESLASIEAAGEDSTKISFSPEPEKYFECYYEKTKMKDTPEFMD